MSFTVTVPEGAPYVLATVDEPYTRDLSFEVALRAKKLGELLGLRRVFFDLRRSPNVESVLSNYEFVHRDMPPAGFDRSARIAILVAQGDHSHDFVETAMVNAGYVVRIFRDEAQVVPWLMA
jgi:hypothetical protein